MITNSIIFWAVIGSSSLIGGLLGFGISTLSVPFFGLFMPINEAVARGAFIDGLNDLAKLIIFKERPAYGVLFAFLAPAFLGTCLGALFFVQIAGSWIEIILGVYLLITSLCGVRIGKAKTGFRVVEERILAFLSGFLGGLIGGGGPIRALVLQNYSLSPAVYVITSAAISVVLDFTRLVLYSLLGSGHSLALSKVEITTLLTFVFIINYVVRFILHKIPHAPFYLVIRYSLGTAGIYYLIRGIKLFWFGL